jgi:hypothetical protein
MIPGTVCLCRMGVRTSLYSPSFGSCGGDGDDSGSNSTSTDGSRSARLACEEGDIVRCTRSDVKGEDEDSNGREDGDAMAMTKDASRARSTESDVGERPRLGELKKEIPRGH